MSVRLSANREEVPEEAVRKAKELFHPKRSESVACHNSLIGAAKEKYGVAVWFSAVEIARQELAKGAKY